MSEIINRVWIDRIAVVYLEPNKMEEVNLLSDIYPNHEVNFVDKSTFEYTPKLKDYIDDSVYKVLINGDIDYIVFRLDD